MAVLLAVANGSFWITFCLPDNNNNNNNNLLPPITLAPVDPMILCYKISHPRPTSLPHRKKVSCGTVVDERLFRPLLNKEVDRLPGYSFQRFSVV